MLWGLFWEYVLVFGESRDYFFSILGVSSEKPKIVFGEYFQGFPGSAQCSGFPDYKPGSRKQGPGRGGVENHKYAWM